MRRLLRIGLGVGIAGQLGLAGWLWPRLPASVPTHFDIDGSPDRWAAPDYEWFVIAGLLAVAGAVLGYVMPVVVRRLAENDSALLNVPDRQRFSALPLGRRINAVAALDPWWLAMGLELQLLMAFLLAGTWAVASGAWSALPPIPLYGALLALLLTATAMAVNGSRAVRREIATHVGSGPRAAPEAGGRP